MITGELQKVFGVGNICNVLYMYMYMVVGSFYIVLTSVQVMYECDKVFAWAMKKK